MWLSYLTLPDSILSTAIPFNEPRRSASYRDRTHHAAPILLPLGNKILVAIVRVDDIDLDGLGVGDATTSVVLKEVDLLRAIRLHRVGVTNSQILTSLDDTVLIGLVGQDTGEGEVVDVGVGASATPVGSVVEAELLLARDNVEENGGVIGGSHGVVCGG